MASNQDKFIKAAVDFTTAIGSGGVADGTTTTIPLVSTTGLPTDTAVQITIDRVDANGTATPAKKEVVTGVVSGTNLINCIRGVEGTAQAHSAGAVVEVMLTAAQWNSMIDGHLGSFNQDGTPKNIQTTASFTPSGAGTTTINPSTAKINTITMPAATQTIAITGDVEGQVFIIDIINNASQGALTWFSGISWVDGIVPTLTGTNGKRDSFGFRVLTAGSAYIGYVLGQNI